MYSPQKLTLSFPLRLALLTFFMRVAFWALITTLTVTLSENMREVYSSMSLIIPMAAQTLSSALLCALVVWCISTTWLHQHNASRVAAARLFLTSYAALFLVFLVAASFGLSALSNWLFSAPVRTAVFENGLNIHHLRSQYAWMTTAVSLLSLLIEVFGCWLVFRIAARSARTVGAEALPNVALQRKQTALVAGIVLYSWQMWVGRALSGWVPISDTGNTFHYLLAYWVAPLILLVLATWACWLSLPAKLNRLRLGLCVLHGTLAFWLMQIAGVAIAYLILSGMSVSAVNRGLESGALIGFGMAIYAVIAVFFCWTIGRILHRLNIAQP